MFSGSIEAAGSGCVYLDYALKAWTDAFSSAIAKFDDATMNSVSSIILLCIYVANGTALVTYIGDKEQFMGVASSSFSGILHTTRSKRR